MEQTARPDKMSGRGDQHAALSSDREKHKILSQKEVTPNSPAQFAGLFFSYLSKSSTWLKMFLKHRARFISPLRLLS
jgi:hypothetical protein